MKHNRKTQIAIFPTSFGDQNATALTRDGKPATVTAVHNDDVRHASHIQKNEERFSVADSAKGLLRLKSDDVSDRPSDVKRVSPWEDYRAEFDLHDLGGSLTLAVRHQKLFHIREMGRLESEEALAKLRRLRHRNIVKFIHAYMTHTSLHAVFEATTISLFHLAKCPIYPGEAQLGAIVGQVVDGLGYMEGEGFEHPSLDSKNILVTDAGVVKITNQQLFQPLKGHSRHHIKALGTVVQLLMQKYCKETPGIDDVDRWPPDSDGFTFLVAIDSASSVVDLQNHRLIRHRDIECLLGLVSLARVAVFPREYGYRAEAKPTPN